MTDQLTSNLNNDWRNDPLEVLKSLLVQCRPYVVRADREGPQAHPQLLLQQIDGALEHPAFRRSIETSEALDAERYRFLRQPGNAIVYARGPNVWGEGQSGHVKWDTPEALDAAVDAARGSQKAGEGRPS